jgi:hypothetical protein
MSTPSCRGFEIARSRDAATRANELLWQRRLARKRQALDDQVLAGEGDIIGRDVLQQVGLGVEEAHERRL